MSIRRLCPVCWQDATPTRRGNIAAHLTSVRDNCPGSALPFTLTRYVEHGIHWERIA